MAKTKDEKDQSATQPEDNGIGQVPDKVVETPDERDTRKRDYVTIDEPTAEPVELDDSPANDIGHVPDPPFHGKWQLDATVNFANAEGGETVVEAGVIDGSELPLDVANGLYNRNLLRKA
jgi:hypothetical protein